MIVNKMLKIQIIFQGIVIIDQAIIILNIKIMKKNLLIKLKMFNIVQRNLFNKKDL